MEQTLKQLTNLALGLSSKTGELVNETIASLESQINDLIAKGEAENSEAALKVRETADKLAENLKDAGVKANELVDTVKTKIEEVLPKQTAA
ncbi:MAG: hypothetical protein KDK38_09090 [Leptospiraceae bacterium]|nr:hypothetical protein [Leptospiraceae bacterium]